MNQFETNASQWQRQDEIEVDFRDMLASLLLRWKTILIWMLALAIFGCGFAKFRNSGRPIIINEEVITAARNDLSEEKAEEAETFFFLYEEYAEQQKKLTNYYSNLSAAALKNSVIQMKNSYFITSSLDNLESVITKEILSEKDYRALRREAPDDEFGASIYERIDISTVSSSKVSVNSRPAGENTQNQYLLTASVADVKKTTCEKMMQILDDSLQDTIEALKETDPKLSIVSAGSGFNYDTKEYVDTLIANTIASLDYYEEELIDLAAKISRVDPDEQDYFNLLKAEKEQKTVLESRASLPKWAIIGAFIGALLSVAVILGPYLFDGKVKIEEELEGVFGVPVLNRVWIQEKKNLFDRWCKRLCNVDSIEPAVKVEMIAADLAILLEKDGKRSLYLLCDEEDLHAGKIADQVKARLAERIDADITIGDPLTSVAQLEKVGAAEMCVVFAELKQSRRRVLTEWRNICYRYNVPVAGTAAVHLCWR